MKRRRTASTLDSSHATESRRRFLGQVGGVTAATLVAGIPAAPAQAASEATVSATEELGVISGTARADKAYEVRTRAALFQRLQPLTDHLGNGDEQRYQNRIGNYSKGLPHNQFGEVDQVAYNQLLEALRTGNPGDFERIPMGGDALLKNPQGGLTYEMAGGDPANFYQPPPPVFASAEIAAEIAENYWMALARDVFFLDYETNPITIAAAQDLSRFSDFRGPRFITPATRSSSPGQSGLQSLTFGGGGTESSSEEVNQLNLLTGPAAGSAPVRRRLAFPVTPNVLFRGMTPGDLAGPYVSQFLWKEIPYGVQTIIQRMRTAIPGDDYLTNYSDWLFAQNSRGHLNFPNRYDVTRRYIRNARDLGEWVHIDVLFQAYLNAALILQGLQAPVDPNNPYVDSRTQCGFGTFGAPHIQSMVCAVATCALRSVWYQKWYVHRRLRPEAFAGRIHNHLTNRVRYPIHPEILNSAAPQEVFRLNGTYLLPMAFPEGCPTHPAYGAGHATVAGACVTVLKAWFDESWTIPDPVVPTADGLTLQPYRGPALTVGGELNKLASNVAIGRDMAGVHWRSDATESLKLGEAVAIAYLNDLKSCYNERFEGFSLTKFDGQRIVI